MFGSFSFEEKLIVTNKNKNTAEKKEVNMRFFTVKLTSTEVLYHGISKVKADWFLFNYPESILIVTQI